jgi:hypothetical protein
MLRWTASIPDQQVAMKCSNLPHQLARVVDMHHAAHMQPSPPR